MDQFTVIRYISDQAEKNLLKFNFYQSLDFLKDFRDPQKVAVFLIMLFWPVQSFRDINSDSNSPPLVEISSER